jgi:hypothetical protein
MTGQAGFFWGGGGITTCFLRAQVLVWRQLAPHAVRPWPSSPLSSSGGNANACECVAAAKAQLMVRRQAKRGGQ